MLKTAFAAFFYILPVMITSAVVSRSEENSDTSRSVKLQIFSQFWARYNESNPLTMQQAPVYRDVVKEVRGLLAARCAALQHAGVDVSRIVVDPGIGFGKTLEHNLELLARLPDFQAAGFPVLVGVSRKSMIGSLTGREVGERLPGSLAAMLAAVARGARIVRVHDVAATRDALAVWNAIDGVR
jgi:dihydropteroate synthase